MQPATTTDSGYLTTTDWNTFNGKVDSDSVTYTDMVANSHVAATAGSGISIAGQEITNTDTGSGAVATHENDYDHTNIPTDDQITLWDATGADSQAYVDAISGKVDSDSATYISVVENSHVSGSDNQVAGGVATDTTNFNNNLSSTDTTVQAALETLDEMVGGSGASSFRELTDVDTYVGHGSEYVKVKATEDGIEYGTPAGAGDMTKAEYDVDDNGIVDSAMTVNDGAGNSATAAEIKAAVDNTPTDAQLVLWDATGGDSRTIAGVTFDQVGLDTGKIIKYTTDAGGKWILTDDVSGGGTGTVDAGDVVKIMWAFGLSFTWRRRRRKMKNIKKILTGLLVMAAAVVFMGALAMYTLCDITCISATPAAVFTNPAAKTTYLRSIILHNLNTTSEVVVLYKVSADDVNTDTNKFEYLTIVANDTVNLDFAGPGIILDAENDAIYARTTTANKVTIQMYGAQE
jgi:hypothetical protein